MMRALILSSRCTVEQRRALLELRAFLEGCGDTCEMLDWLSFLSDTVSEINAHSRKLVRRHIQELLAGAFQSNSRKEEEPKEKGVRRLIEISVKELARFIREGDYELVVCAEPVAALLLRKASEEAPFPALTVLAVAEDAVRPKSGFDLILARDALSSDAAKRETREKLEKFAREKRQPVVKTGAPTIQSSLRHHILKMPEAVYEASGIVVNGRRLKSFVFSTDLAIIRNCDADAVFAVYPFTPQQAISEAIIKAAYVPVFCGVGGGTTKGVRTVGLAKDAEAQGAMGLVLNAPISNPNLRAVTSAVDIPDSSYHTQDPGAVSKRADHCLGRQHKREHPGNHSRRGQRGDLHAAQHKGDLPRDHEQVSGIVMKYKIDRKWKWLWGCMLGAAWISLLILLLKNRGGLSVEDILRCQPESKGKVILVMLGLFTLKSVDFLLHSGVLYAADGVMFSLPTAIAINLLGAAVMVTPPFFIGRTMGEPMLNELTEKHPKIRQIAEIPEKSELVVNILLRTTGLPLLPVALYVGAAKGRYAPYLFGSLLGLLPTLVAYTVMGVGIGDRSSPVFWIAFGSLGCVNAASIVLSACLLKKHKERGKDS